jgi:hypothetical protein
MDNDGTCQLLHCQQDPRSGAVAVSERQFRTSKRHPVLLFQPNLATAPTSIGVKNNTIARFGTAVLRLNIANINNVTIDRFFFTSGWTATSYAVPVGRFHRIGMKIFSTHPDWAEFVCFDLAIHAICPGFPISFPGPVITSCGNAGFVNHVTTIDGDRLIVWTPGYILCCWVCSQFCPLALASFCLVYRSLPLPVLFRLQASTMANCNSSIWPINPLNQSIWGTQWSPGYYPSYVPAPAPHLTASAAVDGFCLPWLH